VVPGVDIVRMKKIEDLNRKLLLLKKEIAKFQEDCKHEKQHVKALQNGDVRVCCLRCDSALRWPTQQELNDWLKK